MPADCESYSLPRVLRCKPEQEWKLRERNCFQREVVLCVARIAGVHLGSGPSSKVSASKPGRSPVRSTTYDEGSAVNCSDLINPLVASSSRSRAPFCGRDMTFNN